MQEFDIDKLVEMQIQREAMLKEIEARQEEEKAQLAEMTDECRHLNRSVQSSRDKWLLT